MRAQTILINMARNASDSENDIRASLSFINQFCPAVIDPATGNEITSNIAEVTAQQARILLNAKLDAIKAAYDATYIGMAVNGVKAGASKVAGAVSSIAGFGAGLVKAGASKVVSGVPSIAHAASRAATFASNHKKALAVGGLTAAAVGTGAYMGAGPAILDGLRTAVPSVFGLSAAAQAAQAAANRPSLLSTAAYYGLGLLGLGTLGTAGYAEYRIRKDLAQDGQVVAHDPEYNPHPHVVGHPSPEGAFNGNQTDIRAARQQDVVPLPMRLLMVVLRIVLAICWRRLLVLLQLTVVTKRTSARQFADERPRSSCCKHLRKYRTCCKALRRSIDQRVAGQISATITSRCYPK